MNTTTEPDLGADGPAAMARPRIDAIVKRRISASRSVDVRVRRYTDGLLIDRLQLAGALVGREYEAALRLYGLYLAAGLIKGSTARYDTVADVAEDEEYADEGEQDAEARAICRKLVTDLGPRCGPPVDKLVRCEAPGWLEWGACLHGLATLADLWGME